MNARVEKIRADRAAYAGDTEGERAMNARIEQIRADRAPALAAYAVILRLQDDAEALAEDDDDQCAALRAQADDKLWAWKIAYPREAARKVAQAYRGSIISAKSCAGHTAVERIDNGEDYSQVIAEMEKESRR